MSESAKKLIAEEKPKQEIKVAADLKSNNLLENLLSQVSTNIPLSGPRDKNDHSYYQGVIKEEHQELENPFELSNAKDRNMNIEFGVIEQLAHLEGNMDRQFRYKEVGLRQMNRYQDIKPYGDTIVVLKDRDLEQRSQVQPQDIPTQPCEKNKYINASFVDSPFGLNDHKIIASQGPMPNTVGAFWRMVAEQNVRLILTICKLNEDGRAKCEQFWPEEKEIDIGVKGLDVQFVEQKTLIQGILIERKFKMTDQYTGNKGTIITQIHYLGWPDHDAPSEDSMEPVKLMLDIFIRFLILNRENDLRTVVHCSAGVGRTGTTIALAQIMVQIWSQKNQGNLKPQISVFSTVRRLRQCRMYSVQSYYQYKFIYDFIKWYYKTGIDINEIEIIQKKHALPEPESTPQTQQSSPKDQEPFLSKNTYIIIGILILCIIGVLIAIAVVSSDSGYRSREQFLEDYGLTEDAEKIENGETLWQEEEQAEMTELERLRQELQELEQQRDEAERQEFQDELQRLREEEEARLAEQERLRYEAERDQQTRQELERQQDEIEDYLEEQQEQERTRDAEIKQPSEMIQLLIDQLSESDFWKSENFQEIFFHLVESEEIWGKPLDDFDEGQIRGIKEPYSPARPKIIISYQYDQNYEFHGVHFKINGNRNVIFSRYKNGLKHGRETNISKTDTYGNEQKFEQTIANYIDNEIQLN